MSTGDQSRHRWPPRWRPLFILLVFAGLGAALGARAVQLQLVDRAFLLDQGNARYLRTAELPAHRGMITDRHGEPLAISSPVASVWVDPGMAAAGSENLPELARLLGRKPEPLREELRARKERSFHYLKRHVTPEVAEAAMDLGVPGVALRREYRRFYPAGEVTGHLLGFTNIDDRGQEGVELAFDEWLRGEPGSKRVVRDRRGRTVEDVERLEAAEPGSDLTLSLDRRLQYIAYRSLKQAVKRHRADAGSVVLLDADSGEVLAMANQPAFNPNNRSELGDASQRNRAVTDVFEPGSVLKPFTIAAGLESGQYAPDTVIDTGVGYMRVGGDPIHDTHGYGRIDVATVLQKSSNVGAAKIALSLERGKVWQMVERAGLGTRTGVGLPGEAAGRIPGMPSNRPAERAALAFGYGVSTTALQLAQAYTALARDGRMVVPTILRTAPEDVEQGGRVMSADTAATVRRMMEGVVGAAGTAPQAVIPGYRVAGKTGTVMKSVAGGYAEDRYRAVFAGLAPVSDPRFVAVVVVDEPRGEEYYGGQVAAPVFRELMSGALRLFNVPPDEEPAPQGEVYAAAEANR